VPPPARKELRSTMLGLKTATLSAPVACSRPGEWEQPPARIRSIVDWQALRVIGAASFGVAKRQNAGLIALYLPTRPSDRIPTPIRGKHTDRSRIPQFRQ
jgi:hypothetical protein